MPKPEGTLQVNGHYIMSKTQFFTGILLFVLAIGGAAYAWGSSYSIVQERQAHMCADIDQLKTDDKGITCALSTIITNQQVIAKTLGIPLPRK